jgi:hypothetical protein
MRIDPSVAGNWYRVIENYMHLAITQSAAAMFYYDVTESSYKALFSAGTKAFTLLMQALANILYSSCARFRTFLVLFLFRTCAIVVRNIQMHSCWIPIWRPNTDSVWSADHWLKSCANLITYSVTRASFLKYRMDYRTVLPIRTMQLPVVGNRRTWSENHTRTREWFLSARALESCSTG